MKEKQVKIAYLPGDIALLALVFSLGAVCLLLGGGWSGTGVIIILCGLMMVPFQHHGYRIEGRRGLFRVREILLSRENREEILSFLDGKTDTLDLHPVCRGGALVEVYYRSGDERMLARYYDYDQSVSGTYCPLREVSSGQVSLLESFALDNKK